MMHMSGMTMVEMQVDYAQVGPHVSSGSFDERGSVGPRWVHDDLVANVVGQDVVILVEGVNGAEVQVE